MCTHINYAFVGVNGDGTLTLEDEYADIELGKNRKYNISNMIQLLLGAYYRVTDLKAQNSNLRVLLSIGGGSASSQTFSNIAADPGKRSNMVNSAREFLETYNFDGIDLDWEYPGGGDRVLNYIHNTVFNFNLIGFRITTFSFCKDFGIILPPTDGW